METKKIWANYTVADLDRTTKFYTQIGFKPNGANKDLTSFKVGESDFIIHFFLKEVLQSNVKMEIADIKHGNEIIFTLSADSREEVDNWETEVKNAGGTIVPRRKNLARDTTVLFLPTLMVISSMCSTCDLKANNDISRA